MMYTAELCMIRNESYVKRIYVITLNIELFLMLSDKKKKQEWNGSPGFKYHLSQQQKQLSVKCGAHDGGPDVACRF